MKPDNNGVVRSWATVIPDALEHDDELLEEIYDRLLSIEMPGTYFGCHKIPRRQQQSRTDTEYISCQNDRFADHEVVVRVWATGTSLSTSWYLRCRPGVLKSLLGDWLHKDTYAFSTPRSILDQQELAAWSEIILSCVRTTTKELADRLDVRAHFVQPHSQVWSS